jgi:hypothetical protein
MIINLKLVLMTLGNRLVTERRFASTQPIIDFTNFLNQCPDAREILAEMGLEWPVVEGRPSDRIRS